MCYEPFDSIDVAKMLW